MFSEGDIVNINFLEEVFQKFKPDKVLNLAAQAGVRYSLENPYIHTIKHCWIYEYFRML